MNENRLKRLFKSVAAIGSLPGDHEEIKLKKSLLVIFTFPFMLTGIGWGLMYLWFGEVLASAIPLSYSVFSMGSVIYFWFLVVQG